MNSNTFSGICARLGAPLHDPRWSWCALAPDGKLAVFTVWQDKFQGLRYPILYYDSPADHPNPDRPGANEIVRVVEHCLANPDTEVLGVLSGAHQPIRDPRVREWVDSLFVLTLAVELDGDGHSWARIIGRRSI